MIRVVPHEHIEALAAALAQSRHPIRVAGALMLFAGLRLGEVHKLTWATLWPWSKPASQIALTADQTKRNRARVIPVSTNLAAAIDDAHARYFAHGNAATTDRVMTARPGTRPLAPRTTQRAIADIGRDVLNIHLTPHMLRHTFATRLLRVSDLETVRMALGHARLNTTQIYVHTTTAELMDAINRVHAPQPPAQIQGTTTTERNRTT